MTYRIQDLALDRVFMCQTPDEAIEKWQAAIREAGELPEAGAA